MLHPINGADNSVKFCGVNGGLFKNVMICPATNRIIAIIGKMRFDLRAFDGAFPRLSSDFDQQIKTGRNCRASQPL